MDAPTHCMICGTEYVLTRKMRGDYWIPACDCEERLYSQWIDEWIERMKKRRHPAFTQDDGTIGDIT